MCLFLPCTLLVIVAKVLLKIGMKGVIVAEEMFKLLLRKDFKFSPSSNYTLLLVALESLM